MSEQSIYQALRNGGLSAAGVCGMMGNMYAESAMRSNNVQDNCMMSDYDYTYNVDNGVTTRWQFMSDSYGYGLCQWTSSDRKDGLYMLAKEKGVSISDEAMQCEFCLYELKNHKELYEFLCTTDDIAKAAERVCAEFERPKYNNFAVRINAARKFFNQYADQQVEKPCKEDACPIPELAGTQLLLSVDVRMLQKGDLGRDVFLLQSGLTDMGYDCGLPDGDYGINTEEAVRELQKDNGLSCSGVADLPTWNIILKPR